MNGDAPQQPSEPDSPWKNSVNQSDSSPQSRLDFAGPVVGEVTWTASEYIDHKKGPQWYMALAVGTAVVDGMIYLWTRELFTVAAITIMSILLASMAARKPQVLSYKIGDAGVTVADKSYPFAMFRSFSVIDEGALSSVMLMPLKRFMVPISIYYAPEDEERIITIIAQYLPYEERQKDFMDRFTHGIKF